MVFLHEPSPPPPPPLNLQLLEPYLYLKVWYSFDPYFKTEGTHKKHLPWQILSVVLALKTLSVCLESLCKYLKKRQPINVKNLEINFHDLVL